MKIEKIIVTSLFFGIAGISVYAYLNNWLIIRFPSLRTATSFHNEPSVTQKKRISLIYWHNNRWYTETSELIWGNNTSTNIAYLINNLLTFLDEEAVMDRKISLQTAILDSSEQEVYISFDRSPFNPQATTLEKWMLIETILKTIHENNSSIRFVHFLEHHQPLRDNHLDFTNPWPITGFIQK